MGHGSSPAWESRFLTGPSARFGMTNGGGRAAALVLVAVVVAMFAIVGVSVTPVPVLRLLALVGLGEFVRIPVVFGEIDAPGAVLVVVPIVIVLVLFVVDAILPVVIVLRCGHGHDGYWGAEGGGQE
jgi:hypothetical protein